MASEPERSEKGGLVYKVRRFLIVADDVMHILVAAILLVAAVMMFILTAANLTELSISSILMVINDILFVLIIMELLWTVIRFLKRQEFSLKPFIAIGIISSLRRILMLEAQMSMNESHNNFQLMELGVSASIVFVLVVAYYLVYKVDGQGAA